MDDLLEFGLLGGAAWLVMLGLSNDALSSQNGQNASGGQISPSGAVSTFVATPGSDPAFAAAFAPDGTPTRAAYSFSTGVGPMFTGQRVATAASVFDSPWAAASPFVYVNLARGFGPNCSTQLWDGKPLCA